MKNAMNAEWYKLRHDMLVWLVPVFYAAMGFAGYYGASFYAEALSFYRGAELFVLPDMRWVEFSFAVVIVTGYVIGGDFSRHTIHNALAAGISKRDYFFSRLLVQLLFTGGVFSISFLIYSVCCLVRPIGKSDVAIEFFGAKLAVYMLVVLLLLLAYVSILNMICYFIKKQVIAMALGMGVIYAELIIRQVARANGWILVQLMVSWLPSNVEKSLLEHVASDRFFTAEFLQCGIRGITVILISSAVGYVKFCHGTDVN